MLMSSQPTHFMMRFLRDRKGATAIEYGLIAALISIAAVAGFTSFGGSLGGMWGRVDTAVDSATKS